MNKILKSQSRLLGTVLTVITFLLAFTDGYAGNTSSVWFYYEAKAAVSATGGGKVYVTASSNAPSEDQYKLEYTLSERAEGAKVSTIIGSSYQYPTVSLNYYANPAPNYEFSYWTNGSKTDKRNPFPVDLENINGTEGNPTKISYQAVFVLVKGLVKVRSADVSRGSASINNSANGLGDDVVLTATPIEGKGIHLLGWKKEGTGDYITNGNGYIIEGNTLKFTVTNENQGTYYAYFSDEATQSYYRIRNKATGKFLCLTGNAIAGVHNATISGRSAQDGFTFNSSLTLVDDNAASQCNPGTVFKFTGNYEDGNLRYTDISSQGVSLTTLTSGHTFTIEPYNGSYRIYTTFMITAGSATIGVPSYLCGKTPITIQSNYSQGTENFEWELFPLTENSTTEAFGANAQQKYTQEGKYYTSMYAPFPYKLLDGVKAYYLPLAEGVYHESTNTIVFSEVTSGIVPANTPVILECKNYNGPSSNRLLPLTDDDEIPVLPNANLNFLKGYLDLNGNKVQNDHDKMYVFSISDVNNKLGFYHFSKDYMTPHKAYLQLPMSLSEFEEQYKEKANNAKFAFHFVSEETPNPTIIELSNTIVEDDDTPVFDLQGRKVQPNKAGIYIKKGKKFVVK